MASGPQEPATSVIYVVDQRHTRSRDGELVLDDARRTNDKFLHERRQRRRTAARLEVEFFLVQAVVPALRRDS